MKAPGLFDFLKSIGEHGGNPAMLDDPVAVKAYAPFMVNRGLAQNRGTLAVANELNRHIVVDKEMHYAFAFVSVPKAKRYGAWAKKAPASDDVEFIRDLYKCNEERALEIMGLISEQQLMKLKASNDKGGAEQKPTRKTKK